MSNKQMQLDVTVRAAEQCELAKETSANITLPPNQPQFKGLLWMQIKGFDYVELMFIIVLNVEFKDFCLPSFILVFIFCFLQVNEVEYVSVSAGIIWGQSVAAVRSVADSCQSDSSITSSSTLPRCHYQLRRRNGEMQLAL